MTKRSGLREITDPAEIERFNRACSFYPAKLRAYSHSNTQRIAPQFSSLSPSVRTASVDSGAAIKQPEGGLFIQRTPRVAPEKAVFRPALACASFAGALPEKAMSSYSDRLKDPRWQRRRLEILQRSDFSCEACEAKDKILHVHHKLYRKGAMPWEYEDHELQALCEKCHEEEHAVRSALASAITGLPFHKLEILLGYAEGLLALEATANREWEKKYQIRSYEHAEGLLAALWQWNCPGLTASPDCLCGHRVLDDRLICALGEGEMLLPGVD